MVAILETDRLSIRPWDAADGTDAYTIYGDEDVAHWLSPVMDRVPSEAAMRTLLQQWSSEDDRVLEPAGRWAVERRDDGRVIGGLALLYLPPGGEDLEIAWQLAPDVWGQGYAAEAGTALARWALRYPGLDELFAVVRPKNTRGAATAKRIGMEWVGETEKYHDLRLQVYRVRAGDLFNQAG
jgi:RimJ/RimL family protein N-acetyltransferase